MLYIKIKSYILDNIDKKANVVVIEIDLDKLNSIKLKERKFKEFSKYQAVDISILVDKDKKFSYLEKCIKESNVKNVSEYKLIDIFENSIKLGNKKSITIRFTLLSDDHTLSSDEINESLNVLIESFEKNGCEIKR